MSNFAGAGADRNCGGHGLYDDSFRRQSDGKTRIGSRTRCSVSQRFRFSIRRICSGDNFDRGSGKGFSNRYSTPCGRSRDCAPSGPAKCELRTNRGARIASLRVRSCFTEAPAANRPPKTSFMFNPFCNKVPSRTGGRYRGSFPFRLSRFQYLLKQTLNSFYCTGVGFRQPSGYGIPPVQQRLKE